MKKIDNFLLIAGVIVVLGGIGLVFLSNLVSPQKKLFLPAPKPVAVRVSEFTNLMRNGEIGAPDVAGTVKLSNAQGSFPGGSVLFVSNLGLTETTADKYDVFGSFAVNYGGSGSFVYVGLFRSEEDKLVYSSMTPPLGDRIIIESATVSASMTDDYLLTVSYLARRPSDPISTPPSVSKVIEFQVKDHLIQK